MRTSRLTPCIIAAALLIMLIPIQTTQAQQYIEYKVQIQSDGSALWTIEQFSAADAAVPTWEVFQQKIFHLIDLAQNLTHRDMDINQNSMQINTTITSDSKITEYSFLWQNFSKVEGGEIRFGDVFGVDDFFGQLFGDAALQLSYPSDYRVQSVYPPPYDRQDDAATMKWARTQDLDGRNTNVVLTLQPKSDAATSRQIGFAILLLVVGAIAAFVVFYTLRKRRRESKPRPELSQMQSQAQVLLETEEDKILKLLKTQGGAMRQSEITEQLRFSKAKTSQLLGQLESAGKLTRYKKGRDKIVTIQERVRKE